MEATKPGHRIAIRALAQALAAELRQLAELAERVQRSLSPALLDRGLDAGSHADAQMLDLLTQRLGALGMFLAALDPAIPESWQVETEAATGTVRLSQLAERLQGRPAKRGSGELGEIELF